MNSSENLVKQFAITDSFYRGTALTSNLLMTVFIALLPNFGQNVVLVAASLQMLVSGLLEIPTGLFSDRFGWKKSTLLGFGLKFLVTFSFAFALVFSSWGWTQLTWAFILLQAIIDSFANSFISGSFESAYEHWFRTRISDLKKTDLKPIQTPMLFVVSGQYYPKLRLLIPIFVFSICLVFYFFFPGTALAKIGIAGLGSITLLRAIVYLRVHRDLNEVTYPTHKHRKSLALFTGATDRILLSARFFLVFLIGILIQSAGSMYFMGELVYQIKPLFSGFSETWFAGVAVGYCVLALNITITKRILSRIKSEQLPKINFILVSSYVALMAALGFLSYQTDFFKHQFYFNSFLLMSAAVFSLVIGGFIVRSISSQITQFVDSENRATWISIANVVGLIVFSIIGYTALQAEESFARFWFCWLLAAFLSILWILGHGLPWFGVVTLRNYLTRILLLCILGFGLAASVFDFRVYSDRFIGGVNQARQNYIDLLLRAARNNFATGSHIEIEGLLENLAKKGDFRCGSIRATGIEYSNCDRDEIQKFENKKQLKRGFLRLSRNDAHDEMGQITLYFDNSQVNSALLHHLFSNIVTILGLWLLAFFALKRGIMRVEKEVRSIAGSSEPNSQQSAFVIEEFASLSNTIQDNRRLDKEKVFADAARKFAHDIRSPITALKTIAESELSNTSAEAQKLFHHSIQRVQNIAQDILGISPHQKAQFQGSHNEIQIHDFLKTVIAMKQSEYSQKVQNVQMEFYNFSGVENLKVSISPHQFERIFSNLINNSIEAGKDQKLTIRIEVQKQNQQLVWLVIDNGPGIPSNLLPHLGKKSVTTKSGSGGNGLGILSASEELRKHGYQLNVFSKPNKGTTIEILMPF
jgi:signal transduction histidine kinase